jgi:hypothetical protein
MYSFYPNTGKLPFQMADARDKSTSFITGLAPMDISLPGMLMGYTTIRLETTEGPSVDGN